MFIVNGHTLHTIGALHFANQIIVNGIHAENLKNVVRVSRAVGKVFTFFNELPFFYARAHTVGDEVSPLLAGFLVKHGNVFAVFDSSKFTSPQCRDHRQRLWLRAQEISMREDLRNVEDLWCRGLERSHGLLRPGSPMDWRRNTDGLTTVTGSPVARLEP